MQQKEVPELDFSFNRLFSPLTTSKAIVWIIVIGMIVYANILGNGFVWDDNNFIINNPDVYSLNLLHLFSTNVFNSSGFYRPVSAVYFAILYHIFGTNPFFYHLIQLLLHITNTCLLFYLLKKFFSRGLSFIGSLLFLIHPFQVESVAYIGASQSELLFLFGIIGLLLAMAKRISTVQILGMSCMLLLSLLTKETGGLFVLMVLLYRFLYQKEKLLQIFSAIILVLVIYFLIRFYIGNVYFEKITFVPIGRLSLFMRLLTIPAIIFYYIKTFMYPAQLAVDQQWVISGITVYNFYLPLLVDVIFIFLLLIEGLYIYRFKKNDVKTYLFFLLWFVLGSLFIVQIYSLDMTVADRWMYFPLVGIIGLIGILVKGIHFSLVKYKEIGTVSLVILFIALGIRTIVRNTNWYSNITLYSHDISLSDNFDLQNDYAVTLLLAGNYREAFIHTQKSVSEFPYEDNLYNLGSLYMESGQTKKAGYYFSRALSAPSYHKPHNHAEGTYVGIAKFLLDHNRNLPEAKQLSLEGLHDYPNTPNLLFVLAIAEYNLSEQKNALESAKEAYMLDPNDALIPVVYHRIATKQKINLMLQ